MLGLLGGTFDPPHLGHLMLGESSKGILGLDHVLYAPVAFHPRKRESVYASLGHRMAMLALALQGNPGFSISRVDVDRHGPHFSVDALRLTKEAYPDETLYFIIGGDNFYNFLEFESPHDLISHANLGVIKRAGEEIITNMHDNIIPRLSQKVHIIDVPMLSAWLSSTDIRRRIHKRLSIRYLVPGLVLDYIREYELYGIS